jgi:hypothetical protein
MSKTYLSGRVAALSPEGHFIARSAFILLLCCPMVLAAQNGVKVSNLSVDAGTVTFNVSWNRNMMPVAVWSDTVWVFVDYNNNGKMERLPVTGATLTDTSAPGVGKVVEDAGNNQGVWVVGNAREEGVFSATVQLFTAIVNVSGACAYASNYPPVAEYITATDISFTGTPIYKIVLKEAGGAGTLTDYSEGAYTLRAGYAIQSFTDATGAPGLFHCTMPAAQTLDASAAGYCEGTAGVQFALRNTESDVVYQLYRDNTPLPGVTVSGTGSEASFNGTFAAGVYHAEALPGTTCPAIMAGTHTITMYPLPAPPTIAGPSSACVSATIVAVPGDHGTGIRWTDNPNTVPVRTVTSSGTYNAVSISAFGCVSSSSTFISQIAVPAPEGSTPDPLCCCACGLSVSDGKCTAEASTGLTLPPYRNCTTTYNTNKAWTAAMLQTFCLTTNDCQGRVGFTGEITAYAQSCGSSDSPYPCYSYTYQTLTCTNAMCSTFSYADSSSSNSSGRCWQ